MPATLQQGTFGPDAVQKLLAAGFMPISASGAIDPHTANRYVFTKSSAAAVMTLGAPTKDVDDGLQLQFYSSTAQAHTITATGLFADGGGHVNLATFNNQIGANFTITAYQGKWYVDPTQNVTMS